MLRSAHILMACVVALLALGLLMIRSASMSVVGSETLGDTSLIAIIQSFVSKNLIYAVLAVLAMWLGSRVDLAGIYSSRGLKSPLLYTVLIALALCALTFVPGFAKNVNGASRWLYLGPRSVGLSFQPSELMKWVMVLALAAWCARRSGVMHRFWIGLTPPLLLVALACGLIVIEDLGTAALIAAVAAVLLVAGGARIWQLAILFPLGIAAVVAAILHSPYRVKRLTAFLDPWADPAGTGYHPIHSMLAFAQGGPAGSGLGNSVQKYYIPEDTTDFLFPVLCEELGLAGAAFVIGLFLAILWVGLGICRDTDHPFGRLVGLGIILTIGLQALINIAVVTVVVPTKGIALPFLSAGGTGWIMTAFALGLVASLDNAKAAEQEPAPDALQNTPPLAV